MGTANEDFQKQSIMGSNPWAFDRATTASVPKLDLPAKLSPRRDDGNDNAFNYLSIPVSSAKPRQLQEAETARGLASPRTRVRKVPCCAVPLACLLLCLVACCVA
mmetsp:Transcript_22024/g.55185  ORF Transcript_22024/g.55185 Transcript_22024/m.55185 type:complete len:105 (-) Transcript_22024:209-523(-)